MSDFTGPEIESTIYPAKSDAIKPCTDRSECKTCMKQKINLVLKASAPISCSLISQQILFQLSPTCMTMILFQLSPTCMTMMNRTEFPKRVYWIHPRSRKKVESNRTGFFGRFKNLRYCKNQWARTGDPETLCEQSCKEIKSFRISQRQSKLTDLWRSIAWCSSNLFIDVIKLLVQWL